MKLKSFSPKSLFGRFLLIVILPTLIVQIVAIYVFFYTHIDTVSKYMARGLVSEMSFIRSSINKEEYSGLLSKFSDQIDVKFTFQQGVRLPKMKKTSRQKWQENKILNYINPLPIIDPLNRFKSELSAAGLTPFVISKNKWDENRLFVKVQMRNGVIKFNTPIKRITNSSSYVFILWLTLTALITLGISILFLRNQVRSIENLTLAANKFGRGQELSGFKPSGSKEVRSAGIAFIKMKERLKRQISQRTDMLSSVSHDLRTPLTRMKIQLEMMAQGDEIEELKQDILDMERLIEEYLNFARGDDKESVQLVKIKSFLQKNVINYYAKMGKIITENIKFDDDFKMPIRKIALKRALTNLLDNAFNYGGEVDFAAKINNSNLIITIDDNGKGVPQEERGNIFKPFYRIDNSRNLDKSHSGLGLAIAMSAINSHGGRIELAESPKGGLRVVIYLPN